MSSSRDELAELAAITAEAARRAGAIAVPVSAVWPTFAAVATAAALRALGATPDAVETAPRIGAAVADHLCRDYQVRFLAPERAS